MIGVDLNKRGDLADNLNINKQGWGREVGGGGGRSYKSGDLKIVLDQKGNSLSLIMEIAKYWSARGVSHQSPFMCSCLNIGHSICPLTCLPLLHF